MNRHRSMRLKDRLFIYFICGSLAGSLLLFFDNHSDVESITKECGVLNTPKIKTFSIFTKTEYVPYKNRENFTDLAAKLKRDSLNNIIIRENEEPYNPKLKDLNPPKTSNETNPLEDFHWSISKYHMYDESNYLISRVLSDMATETVENIDDVSEMHAKILIKFTNGIKAIFKPKRSSREQQTLPNHFYFTDYERHNAEIAAFHLDRILGFRRLLPVIGRKFNIITEFKEKANDDLRVDFFRSPANNTCFRANCEVYGEYFHPICGEPIMLEGALIALMPELPKTTTRFWISPWSKSFSPWEKAKWEIDYKYCHKIRTKYPERRLLDLVDIAIFDYLMGNQNRRSYETFEIFGNDTFTILQENAHGFGKPFADEHLILAPLYQCCLIRESTLDKLLQFHRGPKRLSDIMRKSLSSDPINPILWEPHLIALDRRVEHTLKEVRKCVSKKKGQLK